MSYPIVTSIVFGITSICVVQLYGSKSIDHTLDIEEFSIISSELKKNCEKDLARSKRCVLEYKFIIEKEPNKVWTSK